MTFVLNVLRTVANEVRAKGNHDDFALYIFRGFLCNNKFATKFYWNSQHPSTIGKLSPVHQLFVIMPATPLVIALPLQIVHLLHTSAVSINSFRYFLFRIITILFSYAILLCIVFKSATSALIYTCMCVCV